MDAISYMPTSAKRNYWKDISVKNHSVHSYVSNTDICKWLTINLMTHFIPCLTATYHYFRGAMPHCILVQGDSGGGVSRANRSRPQKLVALCNQGIRIPVTNNRPWSIAPHFYKAFKIVSFALGRVMECWWARHKLRG